jgi:SH3-like domain-containing protein
MVPLRIQRDCLPPLVFTIFIATCIATASAATDSLPYKARIISPGAQVRSGPGDNFYPTDTLAQGDVVEVHRERPGGWLGIRPPEGSFSWLFGSHVKQLDDNLAEVNKDDVASRIGSRLGSQRNAVQVRLKKGEVVQIIGEESSDGKTWYKVAPPSGEFRWIHASHVERVTVTPPAVARPIVTVPLADTSAEQPDSTKAANGVVTLAADSQPQTEADWRAAPVDPLKETKVAAPADSPASASESAVAASDNHPADSATAHATSPPAPTATTLSPSDDIARRLTNVELRLSRIVAEPPTTWQIEPLRQEAQQLFAGASDQANRAAINATLAKLDRFAAIARQYHQPIQTAIVSSNAPITPIPFGVGSGDPRMAGPSDIRHRTAETSQYDAVGILRPVVSKRPGAPQFALVDDRGQVVSFVTPTPDVNLQPYLGHRIGVTGSRGFIPEFQRAHVTAGRVSPLGARMVR